VRESHLAKSSPGFLQHLVNKHKEDDKFATTIRDEILKKVIP